MCLLGIIWILLGFLAIFIHLFYLENYGVPYAHPMVEERGRLSTAFQDFMVRYPLKRMKYRPEFTKEGARVRQKEDEDENNSQMITARQGNRIMILEIFSAAAMFLPQIALQKSYHSGIVVVVMASVMAGIYLWIVDHAARGVSIENVLKRYRFAAIIYYVRFLLNGAFFYLCILYLTKKYLLPDKSTFFIGFPLLLLAYLMNQGGLTKRGRVMEGIFGLYCYR